MYSARYENAKPPALPAGRLVALNSVADGVLEAVAVQRLVVVRPLSRQVRAFDQLDFFLGVPVNNQVRSIRTEQP